MNDEQNNLNSYLNSFSSSEDENKMDKSVEEKMAVLEDIFSSNKSDEDESFSLETNLPFQNTTSFSKIENNSFDSDSDSLTQTKEISTVELEQLKRLKEQLNALENSNAVQNDGQSKGKQKVLTSNPNVKYSSEIHSDDVSQIVSSFMSCFVLAFVTAAIGTGWLINLIIHLK